MEEKHGCKMSQVALAWLWAKSVDSPIIGATKPQYFDGVACALDVHLEEKTWHIWRDFMCPIQLWARLSKIQSRGFCCWMRKNNENMEENQNEKKMQILY